MYIGMYLYMSFSMSYLNCWGQTNNARDKTMIGLTILLYVLSVSFIGACQFTCHYDNSIQEG